AVEASGGAVHPAAAAVPTSIHALRALGRPADRDIGAKLNVEELLVPVIDMDGVLPVSAYGQAGDSGRVHALAQAQRAAAAAAAAPATEVALSGDPAEAPLAASLARLAEAVSREPKASGGYMSLDDVHSGLDAFCRGAGIEPERLPAAAQGRL